MNQLTEQLKPDTGAVADLKANRRRAGHVMTDWEMALSVLHSQGGTIEFVAEVEGEDDKTGLKNVYEWLAYQFPHNEYNSPVSVADLTLRDRFEFVNGRRFSEETPLPKRFEQGFVQARCKIEEAGVPIRLYCVPRRSSGPRRHEVITINPDFQVNPEETAASIDAVLSGKRFDSAAKSFAKAVMTEKERAAKLSVVWQLLMDSSQLKPRLSAPA